MLTIHLEHCDLPGPMCWLARAVPSDAQRQKLTEEQLQAFPSAHGKTARSALTKLSDALEDTNIPFEILFRGE